MKILTFKKHIPTGKYSSFESEYHDIKRNKKIVGSISEASPLSNVLNEEKFSIRFMIKSDENKSGWKWITLKKKSSTAEEARKFVKKYEVFLQNKYDLYELNSD